MGDPMYANTLQSLMKLRGLSQAQLAKIVGMSRQAISRWFLKDHGQIKFYASDLNQIAVALNLPVKDLSAPIPIVEDENEYKKLSTQLLWDRLYPDLESFVSGLVHGHDAAFARLVHVYGPFAAEKLIGKKIWTRYPKYKTILPPATRRKMEVLWNFHLNRA